MNRGATPYINWRRGTLWPYESMAGIGAKFCFVNKVSPRIFREYLKAFNLKFASAEFLFLMDQSQTNLVRFARDLGEPLNKVRELRAAQFLPPIDYFNVEPSRYCSGHTKRGVPDQWHLNVSYCPVCIKSGFHASFHQINLFSRCLLHGDELKSFEKKRDFWNYSSPVEKFIADVYVLLFGGESGWNFHQPDEWLPHAEVEHLKIVRKYLSLVEVAWAKGSALHERWVTGQSPSTTARSIDVLRCHHWPAPLPKKLAMRLPQEAAPAILTKKEFPITRLGDNIKGKVSFDSAVLEARLQWALLLREDTSWLRLAVKSVEDMLSGHEPCQVAYKHFREKRRINRREAFDENIRRIFPRIVSIQELQGKWLTPYYLSPPPGRYPFSEVLSYYTALGRDLDAQGLANKVAVDLICDGPDHVPRVFHQEAYQIDKTLKDLIDTVLYAELLDDIWNAWTLEQQANVGRYNRAEYGTAWCVLDLPPGGLELRMWSRTPSFLPIWNRIHSDQHSGGELVWKHGVLESLSTSGKLSRRRQWENPNEADGLETISWRIFGKPMVDRFHH